MHDDSMAEMARLLALHFADRDRLRVLDVGAAYVNGSYRDLMRPSWTYVGCDVRPGRNVDLVQIGPYRIQVDGGAYDLVISGQCLEHVEEPWRLVPEMARVAAPRGAVIVAAPWTWPVHRRPLDCWRILPDGMAVLLRLAGLVDAETWIVGNDCWGFGRKA